MPRAHKQRPWRGDMKAWRPAAKFTCAAFLCVTSLLTYAGDDASGPIRYSTDLSRQFSTYVLTQKDKQWSKSLTERLKYKGQAIHFVRTSLPLTVDKRTVQGAIYQALERPEFFYVVPGDAMLRLDSRWAYNPGVSGFSMHAPQSLNFIVCLNLDGGVPFLSSSPVKKGEVAWSGHDYNRFTSPRAERSSH